VIVLKSPKGWTGPKFVEGLQVEGTFRAHQVSPILNASARQVKPGPGPKRRVST
jgi:xylulose-5-phosphate/fructose-6-phosphate phosphoketolase